VIFRRLFLHTSMRTVFCFLSEKTTITEEASIFLRLPIRPFLLSAAQYIVQIIPEVRPLLLLFILIGGHVFVPTITVPLTVILMVIGMFLIGIPHGALDHKVMNRSIFSIPFLVGYLGTMALVAF
jgi:hypothetical protein